MLKAVSTHLFLRHRLHSALLDVIARAGADWVELFCPRQQFDYTSRDHIGEIAAWFSSSALRPLSLHIPIYPDAEMGRSGAPSCSLVHADKARRIAAMDEFKRALEVAEHLPLERAVLHLGERNDAWSERVLEHSLTAIEHLQAFARPLGVTLALENLESEVTRPRHLLEILAAGHFDSVGVCLDTGHAHIPAGDAEDGVAPALAILSDRLITTHIHDNHGEKDEHLWPGDGTIDWPPVIEGLAGARHHPPAVLEIHYLLDDRPAALEQRIRSSFRILSGESPQSL
jgi:sugar phosphate isomerase/epimerase